MIQLRDILGDNILILASLVDNIEKKTWKNIRQTVMSKYLISIRALPYVPTGIPYRI